MKYWVSRQNEWRQELSGEWTCVRYDDRDLVTTLQDRLMAQVCGFRFSHFGPASRPERRNQQQVVCSIQSKRISASSINRRPRIGPPILCIASGDLVYGVRAGAANAASCTRQTTHFIYWLKILANSIYGFFVELNPNILDHDVPVHVFSGEKDFPDASDVIENPGPWFFHPWHHSSRRADACFSR